MGTITEEQTKQTQATDCQCKEQIADILKRLEALERDALTMQKIREMDPATCLDLDLSSAKSMSQIIKDGLSR